MKIKYFLILAVTTKSLLLLDSWGVQKNFKAFDHTLVNTDNEM